MPKYFKIDPALEQQLKARGQTEKLKELQTPKPSLLKTFGEEFEKEKARWAKKWLPGFGAKVAEGWGARIAVRLPETKRMTDASTKNYLQLQDVIQDKIKEASLMGDQEQLDNLRRIAKGLNMPTPTPTEAILAEAPTTKQIAASGLGAATAAATGLRLGLGLVPGVLYGGKTIKALQGLKALQTVQKVTKATPIMKAIQKYAVPIAREAGIGAAFFGAIEAETNRDAEVKDIINAAKKGAVIGGGLTVAAAGLGKGISIAAEKLGPPIAKVSRAAIRGLEKAAAGEEAVGKVYKTEVEKVLSYIGRGPLKQRAAKIALGAIRQIEKLPVHFYNKYWATWRMQRNLEDIKGAPLTDAEKIGQQFAVVNSRADGLAETAFKDLTEKQLAPYKDIKDKYTAYLTDLDFIDRIKRGTVPGGQTADELVASLKKLTAEMTPEELRRVEEVRGIVNKFNNDWLQKRIDAGLKTLEEMKAMQMVHPNYIPHNVILEADEKIINRLSGSINVSKTDLIEAVGSAKNIEDPIVALGKRTMIASRVIEHSNLLKYIIEAQEKYNVMPTAKSLWTAEQQIKRIDDLVELKALRQELDNIKSSLKITNVTNKKVNDAILMAEKRIDDILNGYLNLSNITNSEELLAKVKEEFARVISKPFTRAELPRIDLKKLGPLNLETFDKLKNVINRSNIIGSLKEKLIADFQKGLARKGTFEIPPNITGTNLAKELKVIVSEHKQKIQSALLEKLNIAKKRGIEMGERMTTAIGRNIPILKEKFKAFKLERSLPQIENKLDSLLNTLTEKQKQISGVVDELQTLIKGKKITGEQTINFFRKGFKEIWVMPEDMAVAIKNLDAPIMPRWLELMTVPNQVMKALSTKYNLSFVIPNKFRDVQVAWPMALSLMEDMAKKTKLTPRVLNLTKEAFEKLYRESGAFGASIFEEGESQILKSLKERGIVEKLEKLNPLELINKLNVAVEESTRKAIFKKALERGFSPLDAIYISREASIDFAKMGDWMRPLNRAIPFLNARVQGFINLPRAFVKSPEVFTRMMMWTSVYPNLLLYQHNRRFESYKLISTQMKDGNWIIMTGEADAIDPYTGQTFKSPQFQTYVKGEGQKLVGNPIRWYLEQADNIDKRSISQMLADVLGSTSPLEFQDYNQMSSGLRIASQFGPLVSIPIGLITNIYPYFGTPVIPESRLNLAERLQFSKFTPEVTKKVANILNIAPGKLEFILNSMGGAVQEAQSIADMIFEPKEFAKKSISETTWGKMTRWPVLRRFVREATEYGSPEAVRQRELRKEIETGVATEKAENVTDKAEEIWREMNRKKTPQDRLNYLNSLGDELTPEIKKRLVYLKNSRKTMESLTSRTNVEVRALYILMRINEMIKYGVSKEDRIKFLEELETNKILTPEVRKRIAELKKEMGQ